jgi:hypothetical protein
MPPISQDQYDQYSELSTTPYWDVVIGLLTLAGIAGGGLGGIYALGYFSAGHASAAWPLTATVVVLLILNVAARYLRAVMRRRSR